MEKSRERPLTHSEHIQKAAQFYSGWALPTTSNKKVDTEKRESRKEWEMLMKRYELIERDEIEGSKGKSHLLDDRHTYGRRHTVFLIDISFSYRSSQYFSLHIIMCDMYSTVLQRHRRTKKVSKWKGCQLVFPTPFFEGQVVSRAPTPFFEGQEVSKGQTPFLEGRLQSFHVE